jgi:hypothetical protein
MTARIDNRDCQANAACSSELGRFVVIRSASSRVMVPTIALSAWESEPSRVLTCPELRSWLSAGDREMPVFTGVNGTLMARAVLPPSDVAELCGCLDGMPIVVLAHERDRCCGGHTVEDGQAGERCPGAPVAASAGDLNSFSRGTLPGFCQSRQHRRGYGGQPEVRPAEPS